MKSLARLAFVNAALIAAGIVAAELIFGDWLFGPDYGMLNVPRNERRVFDVSNLYPGGGGIVYTRDQFGFRQPTERAPHEFEAVALGGSTTNERYVDDAQTWVAQLEANFRAAGMPVDIANASVDGQTSIGHLAAIEQWLSKIPDFRPRHALVYIGINDMAVDEQQMHQFDLMMSPEPSRRFRQYVMNHSALYNLFRTIRGSWLAREAHLVHGDLKLAESGWVAVDAPADVEGLRAALAPRLAAFATRLDALTTALQTMGAQPIFITQRTGNHKVIAGVAYAVRGPVPPGAVDAQAKTLALFNAVTLATCKARALMCVDLASGIAFADGDFYDALHTTPSGSKKVADFVYAALKDKFSP